ncbi:hypothetical protein IT568_03920 [bacterium]|nr:hypothetical protein [bacterium]
MVRRKKEIDNQLFEREFSTLKQAKELLKNRDLTLEYLFHEYDFLTKNYESLLKEIVKIIRISESYERKLFISNEKLQETLKEVKRLSGLLPICSCCKKIRNDEGYWNEIETYISQHSEAQFSHGICPQCIQKLYPEFSKRKKD